MLTSKDLILIKKNLAYDEIIKLSNDEKLDSFNYFGKEKLLNYKVEFMNEENKMEKIRINSLEEMLDNLIDRNFTQYFIDGTFDVPKASKAKQLVTCVGYNETYDLCLPFFFALLDSK